MSLPKLTKYRVKMLTGLYGWEFVSRMLEQGHRSALRLLIRTNVEAEIAATNTPRYRAGRVALALFRIGRGPQSQPKHRIPNNGYRSRKISHWLKDHLSRIGDMAADAVCRAATDSREYYSPLAAIAAFNEHIAPIAKLYGFELQMLFDGDRIVLRGDTSKALSVLTYLCSSQRTPEIDWMLDVVTVLMQDQPFQWRGTWNRKLRFTKRGRWWRKRRELREQKDGIEAPKERQRELDRHVLYTAM